MTNQEKELFKWTEKSWKDFLSTEMGQLAYRTAKEKKSMEEVFKLAFELGLCYKLEHERLIAA